MKQYWGNIIKVLILIIWQPKWNGQIPKKLKLSKPIQKEKGKS